MKALVVALLVVVVVAAAGCGGSNSSSQQKVWCVGKGERVDAKFKRDYPDLYIPKSVCDQFPK